MRLILMVLLAALPLAAVDKESTERLNEAAAVFTEIMAATDTSIPQDLLTDAHCIVIVPGVKKAAFIFGGKYGKGYLSCRNPNGKNWSAPGTVRIEGGSFGFQIGGSSTDVIMLVMNQSGAEKLLSSKFTLGADASVAAGPVGREAAAKTDAQLKAEVLSWSRSQGLFAGLALDGATLRQDLDDNAELYGKPLENREIVSGGVQPPAAAKELLALLNTHSAREGQEGPDVSSTTERVAASKPSALTKTASSRSEDIKQAQTSLNNKGFDAGPADGVMGPRTRAGISRFQESENLPVTGRLDANTANKLGVELK